MKQCAPIAVRAKPFAGRSCVVETNAARAVKFAKQMPLSLMPRCATHRGARAIVESFLRRVKELARAPLANAWLSNARESSADAQ